ncbi:AIR synthase related protein [Flavilitoribacter nigricans]|uniref:Phosphoribosylformylglycinamidine cyclo-ligase n=1 Tax=Flavilitoribacter nigricans (strain ATCC 23147 / DSM 23189 / NBRC 102662 / NCIMB 1420 / SS-2) TaxID=1122177 RepID=A0A2D0N5F7_FLAN2|nr:AIR synthase-related protein [Flavilitoribacter nigricans]PHN03734.1 phosphoribosylformylglycinamidine cyclo-ligase [Flavilitoribacter nigricans DSM 23189 = NBRC 102662]
MSKTMKYDLRGVSATKDEVHAAIKDLDKGLYPKAFCKIIPDAVGGDAEYCNIMHADTAGTKTSLAYLYWKETGDLSVWRGIAQDALVMNLDDMACVGCYQDIVISSTIGRNKNLIPGEVISEIIQSASALADQLAELGIRLHLSGGETADVGDIVRTIDVGYTAFARMRRDQTIVNDIKAGDVIVGMASYGKASYEDTYNGGMGSNGLTSARHDVLAKEYAGKYPDSFDPNTPEEVIFTGSKKLTDTIDIPGHGSIPVGKLILSPTRTFLPVLRPLIENHRDKIHGMIHCTGGGQTKVQKFIGPVRVIKDNLFDLPPLFKLIQEESGTGWKEMYQVFNMGNRMEVYLAPEHAEIVIEQARSFGIDAQIVGRVEAAERPEVRIESPFGVFEY